MVKAKRVAVLMRAMGRRLRAVRLAAGFETADQFAAAVNLHPQRYRKYERGEAMPPLDVLEILQPVLSVDLDWLLLGIGTSPIVASAGGVESDSNKLLHPKS